MDSLKIAIYTDSYLPAVDGVVTSILNFKKEFEQRGHKVYIFASGDRKAKKLYGNNKVFITQGVPFKPYPQYKVAIFPYPSIVKLSRLKVDIVHAQTPFTMGLAALLLSKVSNKPLVASYHTMINNKTIVENYYPKNKHLKKLTSRSVKEYTKFYYNKCDEIIAPSQVIQRFLKTSGVDQRRISIVPNSVDLERFNTKVKGGSIRHSLGIKDREKMVLFVGRTSKEKRIETIIYSARYLSKSRNDIKFVICGDGPASDHYRKMASRLNLKNVIFTGFVKGKELARYYAASDAFCMPSTFETQGLVAIEAMASGKPVIAADYLALRDLVKNGYNGEKFEPGSYISCSKKIEKVLNNTASYTQNAVNTAKEFSIDKVTDKMLDVYNLALSKN